MSHLIKAETRFNDLNLLKEKVEEAGGFWIGSRKSVRIFNTTLDGNVFHIPDMEYPAVVKCDGELVYEADNVPGIPTGPLKTLMKIMRDYVLAHIYNGPNTILRSYEDELGTVHVDIHKNNKLLKFHVALGGIIKAEADGYTQDACLEDLNKAIAGVAIVPKKKEAISVADTV